MKKCTYIYICIIVLWKHQTDVRMHADFSPNLKVLATVSNNPWMFFPPDRPQRNSRKWTAALIQHHLHRTARNSLGKIQMEVGSHELWIRLDFIVDWYCASHVLSSLSDFAISPVFNFCVYFRDHKTRTASQIITTRRTAHRLTTDPRPGQESSILLRNEHLLVLRHNVSSNGPLVHPKLFLQKLSPANGKTLASPLVSSGM